MKNLLSIGEVAKIKGVSVKSLRYYGEIGILQPAHINAETGYRYYSIEQLTLIDLIITCIDLGISLKQFHNYVLEDGAIDIEEMIADSEEILEEKTKKLANSLIFLNQLSKHIANTKKIRQHSGKFHRQIEKRYFLTVDWDGTLQSLTTNEMKLRDVKLLNQKFSQLYSQTKNLGITDSFNQGVAYIFENGTLYTKIFLELPSPNQTAHNLLTIPAGNFLCQVADNIAYEDIVDNFVNNFSQGKTANALLISSWIIDAQIDYNSYDTEFQELILP